MSERLVKRVFWILGGLLFTVGLIGWYDRSAYGHLHMNYGTTVPWGLGVALYAYFIGVSAGAFLISSLVYVFKVSLFARIGRLAVFTALVTLLMALLSIWPDIGHMIRVWHIFAYPNFKSPMAVITWLYAVYFLLLLAELWFLLRHDLIAGSATSGLRGTLYRLATLGSRDQSEAGALRDRRIVRILAATGLPLAIAFHGGVGALFGVVAARPHWHSPMYPIHFLLAALASGGALLTAIAAVFQDGWRRNQDAILAMGKIILGLLLLDVLFQLSEFLIGFYGAIPGHVYGLKLVVEGPYWWVFWIWQVGMGTVVPVAILVSRARNHPRAVSWAAMLIAAGYLGLRLNIVIPGLSQEQIPGLSAAIASARLSSRYFPSATEWLLAAWVVGLALLLFAVGEGLFPRESETPVAVNATERSPV